MDIGKKIMKFPDGKGGFILKKRDESGIWVEVTEEDPRTASVKAEEGTKPEPPKSMKRKRGNSPAKEDDTSALISVTLRFSKAFEEELEDFVRWKSFTERKRCSKTSVIREALESMYRKHPGFTEYRNKR